MKNALLIFLILLAGNAAATSYTYTTVTSSTSYNFNNTALWSSSPGGGTYPGAEAGDTAVFSSGYTGTVTMTGTPANALAGLHMSGFGGTLAIVSYTLTTTDTAPVLGGRITETTGGLTLSGASAAVTINVASNSNGLITLSGATPTITFSSTWPGSMTFSAGGGTTVVMGNGGAGFQISGQVTFSTATTLNRNAAGDVLTVAGPFVVSAALSNSGTLPIVFNGATWSGTASMGNSWSVGSSGLTLAAVVVFNSWMTANAGTMNFATYMPSTALTALTFYGSYSCTTPSAGTGGLKLTSTTGCTLTFAGTTHFGAAINQDMTAGQTLTISNGGAVCYVDGELVWTTACNLNTASNGSGESLSIAGGLNMLGGNLSSTSTPACPITITGGTWAGNNYYNVGVPTTLNGAVNLTGNIPFTGNTLTYSGGTINAGTSVFMIEGSCTLNTAGMNFYNFLFYGNYTVTLTSALSILGTLSVRSDSGAGYTGTFSGASNNIQCAYLAIGAPIYSAGLVLAGGQKLTITNSLSLLTGSYWSNASPNWTNPVQTTLTIKSSDTVTPTPATINFTGTGKCYCYATIFNAINVTGRPIFNFNGAGLETNCTGIYNTTDANFMAKSGVK